MNKWLVPYLTAGYQETDWFEPLVLELDQNGADIIEIGVPFSDPIADGPTIQAASQKALDNGVNIRWILERMQTLTPKLKSRTILFTYFNPLLSLGDFDDAAKQIKTAGFHGVLIPDLALEQAKPLAEALNKHDLHYIPLVAPTTTDERLQKIAPLTTSFAYGVSVTGVTGARAGVAKGLDAYLERVRRILGKPFVVGFGISTPQDAQSIAAQADGVVVGSALVRGIGEAADLEAAKAFTKTFIQGLRQAIDASS